MLIDWLGFFGSWLLVAGPLYQGVIELREQEIDRDGFEDVFRDVPPPVRSSPWWWLLPPVMLILRRHRSEVHRQQVKARLTPAQQGQLHGVFEKATGWFVVATGAVLLAVKETWELREGYEWPVWVFALLLAIALALCLVSAFAQLVRQHKYQRTIERAVE